MRYVNENHICTWKGSNFTCSAHGPSRFPCVPSSPSAAPSAVLPPGWKWTTRQSFKTQTVLNLTHNGIYSNSGYNLHLSQRSPRLQSRFWRKRHMIRAWRQCRWLHGLGRPEQSQMTQGERGSNRVHLQGRHGLDHLTMCPTNKEKNTPLMGRKLLWHLGLTKVNDFEIKLKLNRKVCFNAYVQTKYRAD